MSIFKNKATIFSALLWLICLCILITSWHKLSNTERAMISLLQVMMAFVVFIALPALISANEELRLKTRKRNELHKDDPLWDWAEADEKD